MKKAFILVITLLFVNTLFGQAYIITYIKGNVYHNHQLLKLHDKLDGVAQITSSDKTAELALFSAEKGKFRLSFINSKPVSASQGAQKSELYQMIVGNYLLNYTTEKTLTTRGGFDLKTFFNKDDTGHNGSNIFLLEGELLPAKSQALTIAQGDNFFVCAVKGKDTICNPVRRNGSFLIFDDLTMKGIINTESKDPEPVSCFVKIGYTTNNKYTEELFAGPVTITFLSKKYLQTLAGSYKDGMGNTYKNDNGKLIADIEAQLCYYYGNNFEPAVHEVLKRDL